MEVSKKDYKYLQNMELEEAINLYSKHLKKKGKTLKSEKVPVNESIGRITSQGVFAKISAPHYNASAMDGIALMANSTFGATETTPVNLIEWEDFAWVDTGDPLPDNYDSVVMVEDVIKQEDDTILLVSAATPWQHVRQIGEDICASEMIIPSNIRIEPAAIGAMLAGGVLEVDVWKKPIVGLIPTGDEIVSPRDNPKRGEIIEFNSSIFSSMLHEWGAVTKIYDILPDNLDIIINCIKKAAKECDIIIINAGSSAGREDYASTAIGQAGEVIAHGLAIRPGKPTILGIIDGIAILGLPGYPVSGIIVMEKVFKRILGELTNSLIGNRNREKAKLSRTIVSSLKYQEFIRMKLGRVGGSIIATPLNRGAGVVTSFVKADAILEIPLNSEGYEAGETIEVEILKNQDVIDNTVVVIGSHDPLLDIVYDIMRKNNNNQYLSSAHVGSMGGIMAIKRGETHIAGIHLLDEGEGTYNISYLRKYFPKGDVILVKGVRRTQGLMVQKNNPKDIRTLEDISKNGIKYVNRQKGSGTRILLDYLLKKHNIDKKDIYGYEREEFTHMSVAALIDAGSGDAGMGIYSAAKIYNLDFIALYEEEYDFIITKESYDLSIVQDFIKIIKSTQFHSSLMELGGYDFVNTGEVIEWM